MSKRKRDFDFDDDDEPSLGRQILPVANLPEDFSEEPADGMEYLFLVRRDARKSPHTTRVPNPYQTEEPSAPLDQDLQKPKHPGLPLDEWRALFEERFRNLRACLVQVTPQDEYTSQVARRQLMPDRWARSHWWSFIAGQPDSVWNSPEKQKDNVEHKTRRRGMRGFSDDDTDAQEGYVLQETWRINDEGEVELAFEMDPSESPPSPSGAPACLDNGPSTQQEPANLTPREPTPTLMMHIGHQMALHLLMYFTYWINFHNKDPGPSSQITENHARWIFALLSRIEDYISADDMSLLRNLARASLALLKQIMQRRSQVENSEQDPTNTTNGHMSESSCWMIITAVVGVWGQHDLWMDAEAMLASLN